MLLTKYSKADNAERGDAAVVLSGSCAKRSERTQPMHDSPYALAVLCAVYFVHMMDRSVLLVLLEQIRTEFRLSDSQLAVLSGAGYALPFALAGLPLGMVADRVNRKRLLAVLVLVWSAFTAVAATSRNFTMLLLTRAGVGASEAGAPPTILSLVADFYPGASRAGAVSVIYVAPLLGVMAGSYIGGVAAAAYGWRSALLIAAVPGALLALLIAFTLREPQRGSFESSGKSGVSLSEAAALLVRPSEFRSSFVAIVATSVVSIGMMSWFAVVLIRVHGLTVREAGLASALAGGLLGSLGSLAGGWIANRRLAGRPRALLGLSAIGVGLSIPCGLLGLYAHATGWAIAGLGLWSFFGSIYMGPSYSVCLGSVPAPLRSTLMALVVVSCNLVGAAGGPQIVGILSDALRVHGDSLALPHALSAVLLFGLFPAWLFWRALRRGVEETATPDAP
jgi:predicted MFS family arabinose efflux permease